MKIMLIDDEHHALHSLKGSLLDTDPFLKVTLLTNGREALDQLAREAHEVVITDMWMPGMDGLTLLEKVKEAYPNVIRIIVDGQNDDSTTYRLLNVAHQIVQKPLDSQLIWAIISQTAAVLPLVNDEFLRRVIGNTSKLPPAPSIYSELTQLLSLPNCSVDDVVKLIGRDNTIAAKLLQLANSAFFAYRGHSVELRAAVVRLGFNTIRHLLLSVELFEPNGIVAKTWGRELELVQQEAFRMAQLAEQLGRGTGLAGDAFVGGLLADIGQVVLLMTQGEKWRACRTEARLYERPLYEVEQERFGVSHAEVGAYLLGIWGLPYSLVEAVANHHHPERIIAPIYCPSAIVAIAAALIDGVPLNENWLISMKAKTRVDVVRDKTSWL